MLYYWTGAIDDLQLYNKTLTVDEQKQIFNNVSPITTNFSKNLIGYWKFDSNLIDYSGNRHDGIEHTLISSMVFAPDGRLFFAEKDTGNVKIMEDEKVKPEPFVSISDYHSSWEQGLLGLAIDPNIKLTILYIYFILH